MTVLGWLAQPGVLPWVALLFGVCVGSFLNVVIHRLPKMLERAWRIECAELAGETPPPEPAYNIIVPRSSCPQCGHRISAAENVPLASRLAQEGLIVDRETANLAVKRWLREVANARVHGTTGEVPAERLTIERTQLQPVPTLYGGRSVRVLLNPKPVSIVGLQHPLSIYDAFAGGAL